MLTCTSSYPRSANVTDSKEWRYSPQNRPFPLHRCIPVLLVPSTAVERLWESFQVDGDLHHDEAIRAGPGGYDQDGENAWKEGKGELVAHFVDWGWVWALEMSLLSDFGRVMRMRKSHRDKYNAPNPRK